MVIDFNTEQGCYAFVKIDEAVTSIEKIGKYNRNGKLGIYWSFDFYKEPQHILLPKNQDFTIIGFVKDLTEEDWSKVVDSIEAPFSKDILGYQDYLDFGYCSKNTATESGKSLMGSLEVYLENPYGKEKPGSEIPRKNVRWIQAEKRVGNWLLIKYTVSSQDSSYIDSKINPNVLGYSEEYSTIKTETTPDNIFLDYLSKALSLSKCITVEQKETLIKIIKEISFVYRLDIFPLSWTDDDEVQIYNTFEENSSFLIIDEFGGLTLSIIRPLGKGYSGKYFEYENIEIKDVRIATKEFIEL
jgi:hypothetical protein